MVKKVKCPITGKEEEFEKCCKECFRFRKCVNCMRFVEKKE